MMHGGAGQQGGDRNTVRNLAGNPLGGPQLGDGDFTRGDAITVTP